MKKVKWLNIKSNQLKEVPRNVLFSSNTAILALSRTLIPILSNDISLLNSGKYTVGTDSVPVGKLTKSLPQLSSFCSNPARPRGTDGAPRL